MYVLSAYLEAATFRTTYNASIHDRSVAAVTSIKDPRVALGCKR
jgi:hypothetical protein